MAPPKGKARKRKAEEISVSKPQEEQHADEVAPVAAAPTAGAQKKEKVPQQQQDAEEDTAPEESKGKANGAVAVVDGGDVLERIKELEAQVVQSKTHSNNIVTLLSIVKNNSKNMEVMSAGIRALRRLFIRLHNEGHVVAAQPPANKRRKLEADTPALAKYRAWLDSKFDVFVQMLLLFLHHEQSDIQLLALHTVMGLLRAKYGQHDTSCLVGGGLFTQLLLYLVAHPALSDAVLDAAATNYLNTHSDLRFFALKNLRTIVAGDMRELAQELLALPAAPAASAAPAAGGASSPSPQQQALDTAEQRCYHNIMQLLLRFRVEDAKLKEFLKKKEHQEDDDEDTQTSAKPAKGHLSVEEHRKALSECWVDFMRRSLPAEVYKALLVRMHKFILPVVLQPLLLCDFLTDSYNLGGVTALLALNGLFTLMQHHNLDYPSFYPKLYQLLQPHIFHTKYRGRFFKLVDLFLASSHLPAYLIAAFAKKFARLSLTAPPEGCIFVCELVYNLLQRHPACNVLLNRPLTSSLLLKPPGAAPSAPSKPDTPAVRGVDPFDNSTTDPTATHAIDSSLWELKTLCSHYCPQVVRSAEMFFSDSAPKREFRIEDVTSETYETLTEKNMLYRKNQAPALSFIKPKALLQGDPSAPAGTTLQEAFRV